MTDIQRKIPEIRENSSEYHRFIVSLEGVRSILEGVWRPPGTPRRTHTLSRKCVPHSHAPPEGFETPLPSPGSVCTPPTPSLAGVWHACALPEVCRPLLPPPSWPCGTHTPSRKCVPRSHTLDTLLDVRVRL